MDKKYEIFNDFKNDFIISFEKENGFKPKIIPIQIRHASDAFKNGNLEKAKNHLLSGTVKNDGQAHAKCNIVATSRPFNQWDIVKFDNEVSSYVLSLHKDEIEKKPEKNEKSLRAWLDLNNINNYNLPYSILEKGIFAQAFSIYKGRIDYIKEKNTKNKNNKKYIEESPFDENGYLKNKPFSKNEGIKQFYACSPYTIKQLKIIDNQILLNNNDKNSLLKDNLVYLKTKRNAKQTEDYIKDKLYNEIISYCEIKEISKGKEKTFDRMKIPKNCVGHILDTHKHKVNLNKEKVRAPNGGTPIFGIVFYKKDWIIIDLRGLLRSVNYRKVNFDYTVQGLLNLFTGDPIINIKYNYVQFNFKKGVLSHDNLKDKKTGYKIQNWIQENERKTIISCDVGVTHPLAARISSVYKSDSKIIEDKVYDYLVSQDLNIDFTKINKLIDKLENDLMQQCISSLTDEQKLIYQQWLDSLPSTIDIICDNYKISKSNLNLAEMNNYSCFIANELLKLDPKHPDAFIPNKTFKKFDSAFIKDFKPKLEKELREIVNSNIWNLKINSDKFKKISKTKQELARQLINKLIKLAKNYDKNSKVLFIIEDLVKKNNFFSGSGSRDTGYLNLLYSKKESRWFMNVIHKTIEELPFKGYPIVKVPAAYTSQTCIKCNFASKENRSIEDRTLFCCQNCGYKAHADKEIATTNIAQTALLGIALSARPSEHPNDARNLVPARKTAKSKKSKEKLTTPNN